MLNHFSNNVKSGFPFFTKSELVRQGDSHFVLFSQKWDEVTVPLSHCPYVQDAESSLNVRMTTTAAIRKVSASETGME